MSESFTVEDIKRLNVQPGDVLLVTVPEGTTAQHAQAVTNAFEANLPVRMVLKTPEIQVEVVREEDAR